jgi:PIN domain nuclease of toxin-antitoxin system
VAKLPSGDIVVDASLLVGIATRDQHAMRFMSVMSRSVSTSVNFGEVIYKLNQKANRTSAETEYAFRNALRVRVEPVDLAVVRHFADLKRIDASSRRAQQAAGANPVKSLSLADMTCLAFGLELTLPVLTGDAHWSTLRPHGLAVDVYDFRDRRLTP